MATYHSQVFVLRYGTHYTSRFLIGGHIVEESFLKSTELYSDETVRKSRQSGARASFMGKFSLSANYGTQVSTTSIDINKYEERVTYRHITSEGGKPFLLGMSLQDWQMTIETNPIILQRTIENITMAIDPKQIPEIEEDYVYKAIEKINNAIETYIKMNLIYGCMERTSLSFNWLANIDDGSCAETVANTHSPSPPDDLCNSFKLSNFHTNTQQCPLGFTQNLLHTLTRTQRIEHQYSYKCGLFGIKRCHRTIYLGTGIVTSYLYSCTKISNALLTQYTFGGSFTTNKINLITNTKSCPSEYTPVRIINDIDVCHAEHISNVHNLPKFAGMFSCQTTIKLNGSYDLCPKGSSAYVIGIIENDCILHVCLRLKTKNIGVLPSISLPPYYINHSFDFSLINNHASVI
ncbi:unnamed protein product [Adineta ricciae]|uniref:MACPF domain-containing protein n=1 Tax=Adineta ricciae TaxID=249248 RepID=A0A816DJU4_ADIRI|nr:unnamed protein product [Adineta ricciae]CAF1638336.1 unnamed protein product [Adineta ricciae]